MPPSAKRSSQRKRREPQREAAPSTDALDSSPSRPSKRRKKALEAAAEEDEEEAVDSRPPTIDDDQLVMQITQQLKSQPVQASKDHANSAHNFDSGGVKAYAKVAASDWTYFVTRTVVNIGRAPENWYSSHQHQHTSPEDAHEQVHIDLGPSKTVSREHASIVFDDRDEGWLLQVRGRNGVKVNGQDIKSGQSHKLASGEVLEFGIVEVMFVLPSEISPLHVHPSILERCGIKAQPIQSTPPPPMRREQVMPVPASAEYTRPGTPPSTRKRGGAKEATKSPSVSTPAVMIGANGADLSLDENQHIKPQYSYAQMITQGILNAPDGKLNLNGIYNYITDTYSYYRNQPASGWQNSIRHNLSLNKAFDKVARSTDEPGKGMKWQIVPEQREEMTRNAYRIGRGGHRGSSAPSSPNQLSYVNQGPRDMAHKESASARKQRGRSPLASPSPRRTNNVNLAAESTPERSSARLSGVNAMLTADGSPLPRSRKFGGLGEAGDGGGGGGGGPDLSSSSFATFNPHSPTLTSSYLQEEGGGNSFVTPAPPRIHPRLAPPSTAQRPSQHMLTSSPAPFWKYAEVGSTPLKLPGSHQYDLSPLRRDGNRTRMSTERDSTNASLLLPPPNSSSPPPRRGGGGGGGNNRSPPSSPTRPLKQALEPAARTEPSSSSSSAAVATGLPPAPPPPPPPDVEDEQGFDLTRGFQSIGSYHAPVGRGMAVANASK